MRRSKRQRATNSTYSSAPDYPEGPPNPSNALEGIVATLSDTSAAFSASKLARVDDFVVRMLFEPKHKGKRRKLSDNAKFCPDGVVSSEIALNACKLWVRQSRENPLEKWLDTAKDVWDRCLLPLGGVQAARLEEADASCFQKWVS